MTKIYIANLSMYNAGNLVGGWIELPCEKEELEDLYCEIHLGYRDKEGEYHHGCFYQGEFCEEWAIHDYECDYMNISEYSDINKLNEIAESMDKLSDYEQKVIKAIQESTGDDIDYCINTLKNGDYIFFEDVSNQNDLGYTVVEEGLFGIEIPKSLENYIDYEQIGRDLTYDGYSLTNYGAICVY